MASSVYRRGGYVIDGVSMAASITSDPVLIEDTALIGVHAVAASGTHVGTVGVYVSNDKTNWVQVTFDDGTTTLDAASGSALNKFANLSDLAGQWLRVVYTAGSGAGTLYVSVSLKRC